MTRLFIHNPLFRILSPLFSGFLIYLLLLLIHNDLVQVTEQFISEELYVCIGLSYLIQEFSRLSLIGFEKSRFPKPGMGRLFAQVAISILLCILLVTIALTIYYKNILGFLPRTQELVIFNGIFAMISAIYISVYFSHRYLFLTNTRKLETEMKMKEDIEADYRNFKRGINPRLLFDSFEAMMGEIHHDKKKANLLIDHLSKVYRYILGERNRQLVRYEEELKALKELIQLFDKLPFRKVQLIADQKIHTMVIPGSLLFIVEAIIRTTIPSEVVDIQIRIENEVEFITIRYRHFDKIDSGLKMEDLGEVVNSYSIYSDQPIRIEEDYEVRSIFLPKLTIEPIQEDPEIDKGFEKISRLLKTTTFI